MAGGWPIGMQVANPVSYGADTTKSTGTRITPSGSANTEGSWVELPGSPTTADMMWAMVILDPSPFSASSPESASVDLGIGASGSQTALISNLLNFGQTSFSTPDSACSYFFPLSIRSGTHLWARSQNSTSSGDPICVTVIGFDSAFNDAPGGCASSYDTYGFDATHTRGTTLTASGTANVKGSYTQLISSTTSDLMGFFLAFDGQGGTSKNYIAALLDLAIGAAGSEVVILSNFAVFTDSTGIVHPRGAQFIPMPIAAGTRIAARIQSNGGVLIMGVTLYGLRQ